MDMNAIAWGALMGGAFSGFGALVGFGLGRVVSGKNNPALIGALAAGFAVAGGALAQQVSPQMVGDLLGIEALSVSVEDRARAEIERELEALPPEQRDRMAAIREVAPQLYDQIIDDAVEIALTGTDQNAGAAVIRQRIADEMASRITGLTDEEFVTWAELQIEMHELLIPSHNEFCMQMAVGQMNVIAPNDLPVAFVETETEVFRLAFGSEGTGSATATQADISIAVNDSIAGLGEEFSAEQIQATFGYFNNPTGAVPANSCAVFVGYLRGLRDSVGENAGPFWRTLMAAG